MNSFGLTQDELEILQKIVVRPLAERGAKVWCFGSRASGTHSQYSDVDLMVEAAEDLSQLISELREAIIESSFPYKVDIVDLKDFAQAYRVNFEAQKKLIPLTL
jgi:predicted nucleotidyltransferase